MLQLKEVIDRYSGQTSATDQIIQGFMQYEAYKNDPQYIEFLEASRRVSAINHFIRNQNDPFYTTPMREEQNKLAERLRELYPKFNQ